MSFAEGTALGPYRVVSRLGAGGMGEVYRATDSKLGRDVAIKVLPDAFARDADRVARFDREARTLASLAHPNIAVVYGLEESGGTKALVMELVEGPTLADRIAPGPLSLKEALPIARQIADALEAAHDRGIVHRDLKPSNIKIRPDGTVKVLDFGLAKAFEAARRGDVSESPTLTSPAQTMQGVILGTAAYMSPEQAGGGEVDERSDIWSFGVVLFEMLTGRRLFDGDSVARVLAKVLEREIDFSTLPAATPSSIRRLLRRSLERDRKRRLRHIADARAEIDEALSGHEQETPSPVARKRPGFGWLTWSLAAAVVVVGGLIAWFVGRPATATEQSVVRSVIPISGVYGATNVRDLAVSPDGSRVVYGANSRFYVRALDQIEAVELQGADGQGPVFSPDGASLLFASGDRTLRRISMLGGTATKITDPAGPPRGVVWGPDDVITFAHTSSGGLLRIPAGGGEVQRLTTIDPKVGQHLWPALLPNGKGVVFANCAGGPSNCKLAVVSLETKKVTDLLVSGTHPRYSPTGHLVYAADDSLRAVPFDLNTLTVTSRNPIPVVNNVQVKGNGAANFDLASNGLLVYSPRGPEKVGRRLVWVDRGGRETPLDLAPRNFGWIRVSPDGKRLAVTISDGGRPGEIWVSDIARPALTRITSDPDNHSFPIWTPAGDRVAFTSNGFKSVLWTQADGTGKPEEILSVDKYSFVSAEAWADAGQTLLFTYGSVTEPRIGVLSLTGERKWKPLIERSADASSLSLSPDGKWIAYQSDDSGQYEIYVERFPGLGDRHHVSSERGGWAPKWAPNGRELFYRRLGDGAMMAVPIQTGPTLSIGVPAVIFQNSNYDPVATPRAGGGAGRTYDVAPDGRFLMVKEDAANTNGGEIVLVQNWTEELKRLAPTK